MSFGADGPAAVRHGAKFVQRIFSRACKAALATAVVAGRPNSNFLDFRVDDPVTRDQKNFLDPIYYPGAGRPPYGAAHSREPAGRQWRSPNVLN